MSVFTVKNEGQFVGEKYSLESAIEYAKELLSAVPDESPATFVIERADYFVLSLTNRRIIGTFFKQEWGGRKNDTALPVGEESFDATDAVLLLPYEELVELQDDEQNSDELGQAHVEWAGPCHVRIVSSICEFFGVDDIRDIPKEAFDFARNRVNPRKPVEAVITLSVKVRVRLTDDANIDDFASNLSYTVNSNTEGAIVRNTEIMGYTK
jgi:hypothetical protein